MYGRTLTCLGQSEVAAGLPGGVHPQVVEHEPVFVALRVLGIQNLEEGQPQL